MAADTHTYTVSNAVFPGVPTASAYTADADTASGAYGADTAAHYLYLVNKVNVMDALLVSKKLEVAA